MLNNPHEQSVNTHKRKYIRLLNFADTICVYAQIDGIRMLIQVLIQYEIQSVCMHRLMGFGWHRCSTLPGDTICVYAQIDGNIKTGITHSCASDTICTYTQVDWLWATLALICASTRSVYVQVDKNNK